MFLVHTRLLIILTTWDWRCLHASFLCKGRPRSVQPQWSHSWIFIIGWDSRHQPALNWAIRSVSSKLTFHHRHPSNIWTIRPQKIYKTHTTDSYQHLGKNHISSFISNYLCWFHPLTVNGVGMYRKIWLYWYLRILLAWRMTLMISHNTTE